MKFKPLSVVIFEPKWAKNDLDLQGYPLKFGESVLFLGNIPNVLGHCAVAKHCGEVIWLLHPEDFRKAKDSEL